MRLYFDTSVFGGYFDEEFAKWTRPLFDDIEAGRHELILSYLVFSELDCAPARVLALANRFAKERVKIIETSGTINTLRDAYLHTGVIGLRWRSDAEHVAIATVSGADCIVSWNFKHITNTRRSTGYRAVNARLGYAALDIRSPWEFFENG